jgi:CRISPR-associated protein Cas1
MSYHIVSIDAPDCSLSCKDGNLTCRSVEGDRSIPLEDVAAIIITSFSASIHSKLLLEAARLGVGLVICENFKPASLVLPANRSSDTMLTRSQAYIPAQLKQRLWRKTLDAKCQNQHSLAAELAPGDERLIKLGELSRGRARTKEAECAKIFWRLYADHVAETDDFRRKRDGGGPNPLLNYGYAVLLSMVLQNLLAVGLDPTFGISHVIRERSTPLAYDLMEPFRPCVDWRVAKWIRDHPGVENPEVTKDFRRWVTSFPLETVDWFEVTLDIRSVIEGMIRSFRQAVISGQSGNYRPWTRTTTKWAG